MAGCFVGLVIGVAALNSCRLATLCLAGEAVGERKTVLLLIVPGGPGIGTKLGRCGRAGGGSCVELAECQ